jgi:type IV secretory pathway TrbL component
MSEGISLKEMGVMLIVCVILLALVNKIPPLIAGVITGASVGGAGIGNFGAGAALGAAGMAAQQRGNRRRCSGGRRGLGRRWCFCGHGRVLEGQ